MNCSQCGAQVEGNLRFCMQCGARLVEMMEDPIEDILQSIEEKPDAYDVSTQESIQNPEGEMRKEINRPVAISRPRKQEDRPLTREANGQRRRTTNNNYQWEDRKGITGFAETMLALIVNPIASSQELYLRLSKMTSIIYMAFMVLFNSCMSYLIYTMLSGRAAELFYDVFDYFFGYGTIQYFIQQVDVQILGFALLSDFLLIVYMTVVITGIYKVLLKVDIEWIECVQLMMLPMVISFFVKIIILLVGLLSIKGAILVGIILAVLVAVLTSLQFINRLGLSAMTVYSIVPIYILCSVVRFILVWEMVKAYL